MCFVKKNKQINKILKNICLSFIWNIFVIRRPWNERKAVTFGRVEVEGHTEHFMKRLSLLVTESKQTLLRYITKVNIFAPCFWIKVFNLQVCKLHIPSVKCVQKQSFLRLFAAIWHFFQKLWGHCGLKDIRYLPLLLLHKAVERICV